MAEDEEPVAKIRIDLTIKGADPNNKLPDNAVCATCERLIRERSIEELRSCGSKYAGLE